MGWIGSKVWLGLWMNKFLFLYPLCGRIHSFLDWIQTFVWLGVWVDWIESGVWVDWIPRGGFLLFLLPGVAPGSAEGLEWKSIKQLERTIFWKNLLFGETNQIFRNISDVCEDVVHSFISMASLLLKFQCFEYDFHESCLSTLTENNYKT